MPDTDFTTRITVDTSTAQQQIAALRKLVADFRAFAAKEIQVKVNGKIGKASGGTGGNFSGKVKAGDANKALAALAAHLRDANGQIVRLGKNSGTAADDLRQLAQSARTLRSALMRLKDILADVKKSKGNSGKSAEASKSSDAEKKENDSADDSAEKNKKAEKERLTQQRANTAQLRAVTKALGAVVVATNLLHKAFNTAAASLGNAANYHVSGLMTGMRAERVQQWRWALDPFGGGKGGATPDMLAIQRNLEIMKLGQNAFDNETMQLFGKQGTTLANFDPRRSAEEFIDTIAPALQKMTASEAMMAGQGVGLNVPMIEFLRKYGANWRQEVDRAKPIYTNEQAEKSTETQRALNRAKEYGESKVNEAANALLHWMDGNADLQALIQKTLGETGVIANAALSIVRDFLILKLAYRGLGIAGAVSGAGVAGNTAAAAGGTAAAGAAGGATAGGLVVAGAALAGILAEMGRSSATKEAKQEFGTTGAIATYLLYSFVPGMGVGKATSDIGKGLINWIFGGDDTPKKTDTPNIPASSGPRDISQLSEAEAKQISSRTYNAWKEYHQSGKAPGEEVQRQIAQNQPAASGDFKTNYPATPDTPLNYMDNASARQIGAAQGRGETTVDVGGIVINISAPSGDAQDIQTAVARGNAGAAEIVRQEFETLDRDNAGAYYA